MRYLKLSVLALLMVIIFPIVASADSYDAEARYRQNKSAIQARNMENTAATGYQQIQVQESHGRKIVTGSMVNRMPVSGVGNQAGNSLKLENEGSVYVHVQMTNSGNVTAAGSDSSIASGNEIIVQDARGVVEIMADMKNSGDITAAAEGSSNVEADAVGNRIAVQGTSGNARISGQMTNNAAITAISRANGH